MLFSCMLMCQLDVMKTVMNSWTMSAVSKQMDKRPLQMVFCEFCMGLSARVRSGDHLVSANPLHRVLLGCNARQKSAQRISFWCRKNVIPLAKNLLGRGLVDSFRRQLSRDCRLHLVESPAEVP